MRILLITHNYAPEVGAPQHRWNALVQRFVAAGHDVAVLAPSPHFPSGRAHPGDDSLRPGAVARGLHGESIHRLRFLEYDSSVGSRGLDQLVSAADAVRVGLARFSGRHRPDVVVATAPGLPSLAAGLVIGTGLRVPLVMEVRDAWPDLLNVRHEWGEASAGGPQPPPRHLATALGTLLSLPITVMQRGADAVVTTTVAFADVLHGRGMHPVRVIRNATHLPFPVTLPSPNPASPELRVLYLGTVGRSQGLGSAVWAAHLARRAGVPVRLRIIGDGAEAPALAALIRRLDAPVTMLPPVPHAEVLEHYAWADTVLVSLRGWEPLQWTVPSKLYEVLSTGRHLTGMIAGEAARIVENTGGGHVVPPGDSVALAALWARLHDDRQLLEVGPGPGEWVAVHADNDMLADQYLELLAEVSRG